MGLNCIACAFCVEDDGSEAGAAAAAGAEPVASVPPAAGVGAPAAAAPVEDSEG